MTDMAKLIEVYIRAKQHAEVMHDVAKNIMYQQNVFSHGQIETLFSWYVKALEVQDKALKELTEALLA